MADDDRWVVLAPGLDSALLEAWREALEEEGIPAQMPGLRPGQTLGGLWGSTGAGVEVRVRASDVRRAKELLELLDGGHGRYAGEEPDPSMNEGAGPYRGHAGPRAEGVAAKLPLMFKTVGEIVASFGLAVVEVLSFRFVLQGDLAAAVLLVVAIGIDIGTNRDRLDVPRRFGRIVAVMFCVLLIIRVLARSFGLA